MTVGEKRTEERLERSHKVSELLRELFNLGFRSPAMVKSLMIVWFPKYVDDDMGLKFRQFWNGKPRSQEMLDELQYVVENVKLIMKK